MATQTTKSVDVGSMFLMDLTVNDSDPYSSEAAEFDSDKLDDGFRLHDNIGKSADFKLVPQMCASNHANQRTRTSLKALNQTIDDRLRNNRHNVMDEHQAINELSSSLDRLASVINCSDEISKDENPSAQDEEQHSLTIVDVRAQLNGAGAGSRSYSFSDDSSSFATSSDTSLTASYNAYSENEDRESTTTREDSGVLDMRDLDNQLNNSYEGFNSDHHHAREQEKPISNNITVTNLINNSIISSNHHQRRNHKNGAASKYHPNRLNEPTNDRGNHDNVDEFYHNHHQHTTTQSHHSHRGPRRAVSASLPIQVPMRHMKKNINKMKLNLIERGGDPSLAELEPVAEGPMKNRAELIANYSQENANHMPEGCAYPLQQSHCCDDDEIFLEQEYNLNHRIHYPIDEYDEQLRAEDDPMKLFESIQALARSLHEDAEIFGSLPPKRLLESSMRSTAFV